jgi:hypothetical protein
MSGIRLGACIALIVVGPKEKFMFTLYARPGAGSAAVEALLAECGVEFRIEEVLRMADGSVPEDQLYDCPTTV